MDLCGSDLNQPSFCSEAPANNLRVSKNESGLLLCTDFLTDYCGKHAIYID